MTAGWLLAFAGMTAEDSSFHKILPDLKKGRSAVIEMFGYLSRFDRMMFSCSYRAVLP